MPLQYLLCYDIADDARLRRVASIAEKYGVRLQYSVFLVRTTKVGLQRLLQELQRAIHPRQDDVRLYPLPAEPSWEHHGVSLWPEGIIMSGRWPRQAGGRSAPGQKDENGQKAGEGAEGHDER